MTDPQKPLVEAVSLRKVFTKRRTAHVAVDDVSFRLAPGESLAVVGESGSGKSTVARMVMGMTAPTSGHIELDGGVIPSTGTRTRARLRRAGFVQMVFQDPYSSLDPRQRVGDCLAEALTLDARVPREDVDGRVTELLAQVALDPALARSFPRALSGGQRQRVAIARALAPQPRVLVLDEAVSALDVSVQARVLELLRQIRDDRGLSLLFISHDLGVVREISDRVIVMQNGRVVETGPTATVLDEPQHPYTRLLKSSVPGPGWNPADALAAIAAYREQS